MTNSKTTKSKSSKAYTYAIGRRKASIANLKLYKGKSESIVNGKALEVYFPLLSDKLVYSKPFVVTKTTDKYYWEARVSGGGKQGQLEAMTLALARALKIIDISFGPILRNNGLMTVDSRVRQRRMVGTGGKARRAKQSPKR